MWLIQYGNQWNWENCIVCCVWVATITIVHVKFAKNWQFCLFVLVSVFSSTNTKAQMHYFTHTNTQNKRSNVNTRREEKKNEKKNVLISCSNTCDFNGPHGFICNFDRRCLYVEFIIMWFNNNAEKEFHRTPIVRWSAFIARLYWYTSQYWVAV